MPTQTTKQIAVTLLAVENPFWGEISIGLLSDLFMPMLFEILGLLENLVVDFIPIDWRVLVLGQHQNQIHF